MFAQRSQNLDSMVPKMRPAILKQATMLHDSTFGPVDTIARQVCENRAGNEINEMIRPWRERGLVHRPAESRHEGEQVVPIHIGSRLTFGLSAEK